MTCLYSRAVLYIRHNGAKLLRLGLTAPIDAAHSILFPLHNRVLSSATKKVYRRFSWPTCKKDAKTKMNIYFATG